MAEAGTLAFLDPQSIKEVVRGSAPLASYHLIIRIKVDVASFPILNKWLIKVEDWEGNILE